MASYEGDDLLRRTLASGELDWGLEGELAQLALQLKTGIETRITKLTEKGRTLTVLDPDWCRENPEEAGQMHADMIIDAYSSTYALPNKDARKNQEALQSGNLDMYLMLIDGQLTGTACLLDNGDGRAELGRSAGKGRSANSIILDLRILHWLVDVEKSQFHTLFTTLRTAPNRVIDDTPGVEPMRGGQAITEHWRKFPALRVQGIAPLYLKHGMLEQFVCASISRSRPNNVPIYIHELSTMDFVADWHSEYGQDPPVIAMDWEFSEKQESFIAHYPPLASGLTDLVHADIVLAGEQHPGKSLEACIAEVSDVGSTFTQIVLPIDVDTRRTQQALELKGYQVFGYQQGTEDMSPALLYGKVRPGIQIVPTEWAVEGKPNPFWKKPTLVTKSQQIAERW